MSELEISGLRVGDWSVEIDFDGDANYSHCRGEFNADFEKINSYSPISTYGLDFYNDKFVNSKYISGGTIMGYYSGDVTTEMTYNGNYYNTQTNGNTLIATVVLDKTPAYTYNYYSYIFRQVDDKLGLYFGQTGYDLTAKISTTEGTTPRPVAHSSVFNDYETHTVALRYDKDDTGNASILIDGVVVDTVQRDGTAILGNDIMHIAYGIYGKFFSGNIKDVFIYGAPLSNEEINQTGRYDGNISNIQRKEDLMFFNPGVGNGETLMLDLSGKHNHGVAKNFYEGIYDKYSDENSYLQDKDFMTMDVTVGSNIINESQMIVPYDIYGNNPLESGNISTNIFETSNINYYTYDNQNMNSFDVLSNTKYYDNVDTGEIDIFVEGYNRNEMDFCKLYDGADLIDTQNVIDNNVNLTFEIESSANIEEYTYNIYCEDITGNNQTKAVTIYVENYDKAQAAKEGITGVATTTYIGFGLLAVALLASIAFLFVKMFENGFDTFSLISISIMAIGLAIVLFVGYIVISAVARGLIG